MRAWLAVGLFLVFAPGIASVRADLILKRDGGRVEGEIVADERDRIVVKTRFGTVTLPRDEIDEIRRTPDLTEAYSRREAETPNTAEAQFELALWCIEQNLTKESQRHLERVIELDPEHAEARKRLGYEKVGDRWLTEGDARSAEGLVKYRGRWMTPQERAQREAKRVGAARRQELGQQIRSAQRGLRLEGNADRREEAREDLLSIDDPAAVPLLIDILGERGSEEERALLVEVLARIDGEESTQALVSVALRDDVEANRSLAIDALIPRKSAELVSDLIGELRDKENDRVRRSAVILGALGDSSAVPPLVDALITTHRRVEEPSMRDVENALAGPSIRTAETVILPDGTIIRRSPLSGMTLDQAFATSTPQRRVIVEELQNDEVLVALQELTGENFGFSKDRWRAWLKAEYQESAARRRK